MTYEKIKQAIDFVRSGESIFNALAVDAVWTQPEGMVYEVNVEDTRSYQLFMQNIGDGIGARFPFRKKLIVNPIDWARLVRHTEGSDAALDYLKKALHEKINHIFLR